MKEVQRQYEPRYGNRLPDLDLDAFSPVETYEPGNYQHPAFLAKPQESRRPGAASSLQNGKREAEQAASRAATARTARSKAKLTQQAKTVGATQGRSANAEHLHAERSPEARKERLRATCKERPRQNKGRGGSRAFVPWCDRR